MQPVVTRYRIDCQVAEGVVMGARRGAGNLISTLEFIPGTSFRGALAALYKATPGAKDWSMFREGASFPDLTPGGAEPISLSARSCKYAKGFRNPQKHGVYDVLLAEAELKCDECEGEMKAFGGWLKRGGGYSEPDKAKNAVGHAAIAIETRTAAAGLYYLEENVRSKDGFTGELISWGPHEAALEDVLTKAAKDGLRLGHGKSKGTGWADVEVRKNFQPGNSLAPPGERIRGMQRRVNDAAISVTLKSRAILLDEYLRFRSGIEVEDLSEAAPGLSDVLKSFTVTRQFAATDTVYGWNAESKMPRSPDVAVRAGASFLLTRERPLDEAEIAVLEQGAAVLETYGIGERCVEGFGRVIMCDPFHWRGEYERTGKSAGDCKDYVLH